MAQRSYGACLCAWALLPRCALAREVHNLDIGWRFSLTRPERPNVCNESSFPVSLPGQCLGLNKQGRPEDGGPGSAAACGAACCQDEDCNVWQWCSPHATGCPQNSCWIGFLDIATACGNGTGWEGRGDPSLKPVTPERGDICEILECQSAFDDRAWRQVAVPHDFIVEGNFSIGADKLHGYLPYGVGWYRRTFCLPPMTSHEVAWLDFDGVMVKSQVWLNGVYLGGHNSGYTPFQIELDLAFTRSDCSNVLAVRVDARAPDGWWYDGGGIYRHVSLTVADRVRVAQWGLYAPAVIVGRIHTSAQGQVAAAEVHPSIELVNNGSTIVNVTITYTVRDAAGTAVVGGSASSELAIGALQTVPAAPMALSKAALWSPDNPNLYTLTAEISSSVGLHDVARVTFGVRQVAWNASIGFILNGVPTKILGTANHQDFAVIGVAVPDQLQAHRIRKLKEFGSNAWRTAHNPPTVALLDAADREGMLVWDENHRNGEDSEMETLVRRDRNHPCIIIWSVCNEALCDTEGKTSDVARLSALAHRLDPLMGRVVSANENSINGPGTPLDLQGFDYSTDKYDAWHQLAPTIPAISSETASTVSDRSVYFNDLSAGHIRDYDTETVPWGQTAQVAWNGILNRGFIAGGFTWTGWDYRGEPTPGKWPDVSSHFGIVDLAGFWKERAYWYKACWKQHRSPNMLHVLPHWNWGAGAKVDVWAYSTADEVELIHPNGTSLGRQKSLPCNHTEWLQVPYVAGRLTARGYVNGNLASTTVVETTGNAVALMVSFKDGIGAEGVLANGGDVALVVVEVVDSQGRRVPTASDIVTISVDNSAIASVLGTANGDPASLIPNTASTRPAFGGLMMAMVRPSVNSFGTVVVRASAPGLRGDSLNLRVVPPIQRLEISRKLKDDVLLI